MGLNGVDVAFFSDSEEQIAEGLIQAWQNAHARKDVTGELSSHAAMEALRAKYNYSGGPDGSKFIVLSTGVDHDRVAKENIEVAGGGNIIQAGDPYLNVNGQTLDTGLPDSSALTLPSINIPQSTKSVLMYMGLGIAGLMVLKMIGGGRK